MSSNGEVIPPEIVENLADARWRSYSTLEGRVHSIRVRPWSDDVRTLEITLVDETGGVDAIFLGRHAVAGIRLGVRLRITGRVGSRQGHLAILNPIYDFVLPPQH